VNHKFSGVVKCGPFEGLKFWKDSWWGATDRANMLLRLYEQELLTQLKSVPRRYCYFIAVGAADGYYGIGVLVGSFFEKSWCYEISEQRQDIIRGNAELSNLSDRIVIRGKAESELSRGFGSVCSIYGY